MDHVYAIAVRLLGGQRIQRATVCLEICVAEENEPNFPNVSKVRQGNGHGLERNVGCRCNRVSVDSG
jgi:hypothetical protein